MELFLLELRQLIPPLHSQEEADDPIVYAKFFAADSNFTWYVTEGSPEDEEFIFFGYVIGVENEWGYFALSELESARGELDLPIERDSNFLAAPFSRVICTGTTGGKEQ